MKKNDIVEAMITDISFPNKGKGTAADMPVTVKNTIPGQSVKIRITKKREGSLEGLKRRKAVLTRTFAAAAIISA